MKDFEPQMLSYVESKHPEIFSEIKDKKEISPDLEERMKKALGEFKSQFQAQLK
jgi:F-type H+/Na+-transporting ATPase subunit alpha